MDSPVAKLYDNQQIEPLGLVALNCPLALTISVMDKLPSGDDVVEIEPICLVRIESANGSFVFPAPLEVWREAARTIESGITNYEQGADNAREQEREQTS